MKTWIPILAVCAASYAAAGEPVTKAQLQEWRKEIRSALFVPERLPALNPRTHSRFEPEAGVIAERVTFGTQYGLRVPAILYLPKKRSGKIPALIVVNGHGGDKYSWYAFYSGILYARGGAAVLTYDPTGEGERNSKRESGTRAHDRLERIPDLARHLAGLMITDIMQAVSYLSQRPEVDAKRISAAGYSMGSFILSIAGSVEERLRACVLAGGGNLDGPEGYWDKSKPMCQGIPYRSLMFLGDRAAAIYALHASRGPTLVFNGLEDSTVGIPRHNHRQAFFDDLKSRVVRLRGSSNEVFDTGFVPRAGHRPHFVTRPVVWWLDRKLDLPNWTEQEIQSMPDTLVSEWAAKGKVSMDRLYATPEKEGGARALGTGVPALDRSDLSVFSPDQWEREKETLTLESWVEKATAEIH